MGVVGTVENFCGRLCEEDGREKVVTCKSMESVFRKITRKTMMGGEVLYQKHIDRSNGVRPVDAFEIKPMTCHGGEGRIKDTTNVDMESSAFQKTRTL